MPPSVTDRRGKDFKSEVADGQEYKTRGVGALSYVILRPVLCLCILGGKPADKSWDGCSAIKPRSKPFSI